MSGYYNLPSDTPRDVMEMQVAIILQKPLLERLQMCADMTDFSYNMLKKLITESHKDSSGGLIAFEIIKSLYPDCFDEEQITRIKEHFVGPNTAN